MKAIHDTGAALFDRHPPRFSTGLYTIATLAGGIAHDFNNLLQIIMGFADLLLRDKDKLARSQEGLRSIRAAARRGADLVNRILTFSRAMPTEPRPINLNHVVERSVKLLSRTIPKMIRIELDLEALCKPVFADPGQMEQSMMNLAINAKDAMPEGGTMTIRTRNLTLDEEYCRRYPEVQPGDYVGLYVSDTGCGMANEVLDRIFDPFFTTKRPGEGTGLGLSIVFGIVKAHGGHVSCSSQPGTGTTFEIVLPAMETEVKADVDVTGEMPAFGTETVLLVDDEQLIRDMGKEILSQAGYTVLTASDGQAALDIYREQSDRIALVILDMVMPRMGGTQCLEELLTIGPNVRVLVATGLLIDEQMRSFLAQRAKGFVKKPFRGSELLRAVRHVLESD